MLGHFLLIWLVLPVGGFSPMVASNSDYYDTGFVIQFARHLIALHRFETIITFESNREPEMPPGQQLVMASLEHQLAQQLKLPIIIWGLSSNATFYTIITHKTLVFATIDHYSPKLLPMLKVLHETLQGRHNVYILFIVKGLSNRPPTQRKLNKFFTWCWCHNFVNVALTFQQIQTVNQVRNELFTYTPFPKVKAINVTSFGVDFEWPYFNPKDVKGYEFRIPYFNDPPTTYMLSSGQLRGIIGSIITEYIQNINGSMIVEFLPHVNRDNYHEHTMLAAARGEVDIGAHKYSSLNLNSNMTTGMLSYTLSRSCLMVPWIQNSPVHIYFAKYIQHRRWLLLVITMIVMPLGWQLWRRQGLNGLYMAFVLYSVQPLGNEGFRRLPPLYKFIHLGLITYFLTVRAMGSAILSASFSVKEMGPQIHTVDDFLDTPLRIMITQTQQEMFFKTHLLPVELIDRLLIVNRTTLSEHQDNLNTSYAYIAISTYPIILKEKQRFMSRPLFRVVASNSRLCTAPYYVGVPMQFNSPFKETLFRFYLKTLRSGIQAKWLYHTKVQLFNNGFYFAPRIIETPFANLTIRDFYLLIKICGVLFMLDLLSLLLEILWMRCSK